MEFGKIRMKDSDEVAFYHFGGGYSIVVFKHISMIFEGVVISWSLAMSWASPVCTCEMTKPTITETSQGAPSM